VAPIRIKAAVPKLEPLILVLSATYGQTREMIKVRWGGVRGGTV
jgi:hypothetical protein